jgi:hypothetical protein
LTDASLLDRVTAETKFFIDVPTRKAQAERASRLLEFAEEMTEFQSKLLNLNKLLLEHQKATLIKPEMLEKPTQSLKGIRTVAAEAADSSDEKLAEEADGLFKLMQYQLDTAEQSLKDAAAQAAKRLAAPVREISLTMLSLDDENRRVAKELERAEEEITSGRHYNAAHLDTLQGVVKKVLRIAEDQDLGPNQELLKLLKSHGVPLDQLAPEQIEWLCSAPLNPGPVVSIRSRGVRR